MKTSQLGIAVRAYTERPGEEPLGAKPLGSGLQASPWTLVFDCETTIDASQSLRLGFFQVRQGSRLHREGLFFDPEALTVSEVDQIQAYAAERDLVAITVGEFRDGYFLKYGYRLGGTIVGFNLPFDIARIAINHSPARGRAMRGGFSFRLSESSEDPRVRVKHLSPKAALIDFSKPGNQESGRGMRNRGFKVPANRGHFVDVRTLASALLSKSFSLARLADHLNTQTEKHDTDEHGHLSEEYLDYARADVQVTWECYSELLTRYSQHGLSKDADRILSEATIGKAYLQEMGIQPFLGCNPNFPREHFGPIMCAYYGGRAEVHIRREITEILYCDFKSMYPTVNSLMGLWSFAISDSVIFEDTTKETRLFLEQIATNDLQEPEIWKKLTTLVQVVPDKDLFPVRAKYNEKTYTIGLNFLTCEQPLWYTLADCIAAKILSGKSPRVVKAITYSPGQPQENLKSIEIMGRPEYRINPLENDFFRRLVDLRDDAKGRKDEAQLALKILVNSTSYGIFIEINRDDAPKSEKLCVVGPNGTSLIENSKAIEQPGRFFNPMLAVLITGAARLMLALAECKTNDYGLNWAFCDTDSLAISRPKGLSRKEFRRKAQKVTDWFKPLNPYKKAGSILQIEDANFGIDSKELEPLFCLAISAKRYALFNLDDSGDPILRKASAHGLGHLIAPYPDTESVAGLPEPQFPLPEIGVRRWQHDLWVQIIRAALNGHTNQVPFDWHSALGRPAAQRYTASSPHMLGWLDRWHAVRPYTQQVKPFGFLLNYMARTKLWADVPSLDATVVTRFGRGRPNKPHETKPIAPYDSDPSKALSSVFCRQSGESVVPGHLKTYAEALAQYHLSCEDKFENGQFLDQGLTTRRYIAATSVVLIGKEANRVGESGAIDPITSPVQQFEVPMPKSRSPT